MTLELTTDDLAQSIFFAAGEAFRQPKDYSEENIRAQVFHHLRQAAYQFFVLRGVETYITIETPDPKEPLGPTFEVAATVLHAGEPYTVLTVQVPVP